MPRGNIEICGANFHLIEPKVYKRIKQMQKVKGSQIPKGIRAHRSFPHGSSHFS